MTYRNADMPKPANPYPQAFYARPADYAKGKYAVTTYDARDGYKGPAGLAADDVGAKYVNRSNGYQMSPRQYARFIVAYETILAKFGRPTFDAWVAGAPFRTTTLGDRPEPLTVTVVTTPDGFRVVRYEGRGKFKELLFGSDEAGRMLYDALAV